jgi:hypothetical protein
VLQCHRSWETFTCYTSRREFPQFAVQVELFLSRLFGYCEFWFGKILIKFERNILLIGTFWSYLGLLSRPLVWCLGIGATFLFRYLYWSFFSYLTTFFSFSKLYRADHSDPAIWGTKCFPLLEHWGRRFESHSRLGYVCFLFCVCVVLYTQRPWDRLIPVQGILPAVCEISRF